MVYKLSSPEQTEALGRTLALTLKDAGIRRAFITLDGEMGVGKTVFCRGFASAFGISGVKSPTYTIVNEHRSSDGVRIFHFDLYRIDGEEDLESIGFDDYVRAEGYCIAEWSSRVPDEIPTDAIRILIGRDPEDEMARVIEIDGLSI